MSEKERNNKKIFRVLTILNDETRISILESLKQKSPNKIKFSDILALFKNKITAYELSSHIRILYNADLIRNSGYMSNAEFSITPYGKEILNALENDQRVEALICAQ